MTQVSFAVFPFLKTSRPVRIGNYVFRSTEDVGDLDIPDAAAIREIAGMLFLKDDLRLLSASYAVLPRIDVDRLDQTQVRDLVDLQAFVAYLYASPHESFGDLFLSSEHASMAILTPGAVSEFVVRPNHHVVDLGESLTFDERHEAQGYTGVYNFRHHFWVAKGSRLYGPVPHPSLNIAQDLSSEVERVSAGREDYRLLFDLLGRTPTVASSRMLTAVRWFNAANTHATDDLTSVVNLSIAFETLLKLPTDNKTNRFTDTVSLLLGRLPRLEAWAHQFYDARSRIVHEGQVEQLRFFVGDRTRASEGQLYQSLVTYGRQVFQLCLGTLLLGLEMAERAGIEEKLVTNQERFEQLCRTLKDSSIDVAERLRQATPTIAAIQRYRFVYESNLKLATVLSGTRKAVECLIGHDPSLRTELRERLAAFATAQPTTDHFEELDRLRQVAELVSNEDVQSNYISDIVPPTTAVLRLVKAVWLDVFMHYFWLKERREKVAGAPPE